MVLKAVKYAVGGPGIVLKFVGDVMWVLIVKVTYIDMENKENNPTTAACTVTEENDSKKDEPKKDESAKTSPSE